VVLGDSREGGSEGGGGLISSNVPRGEVGGAYWCRVVCLSLGPGGGRGDGKEGLYGVTRVLRNNHRLRQEAKGIVEVRRDDELRGAREGRCRELESNL